jgi:hypothetical protein
MKLNAKFINSEEIEGYVYSTGSNFNELSERVTGENSKKPGTKYIAGDLDIAVDETGINVVTIHYSYVTETYSSGKPNSTYTTLKKIIDNPERVWINGGKDNAFKVQCTGVSLGVNDFIAGDGTKVAALRNENGFCTIINEFGEKGNKNKFTVDMLITKVTHVDKDPEKNIKEDYATVSGCIFGYGPKIIPATFTIRNADGMKYYENLDASPANPVFTKLWGLINCKTEKVERKEDSAFGEAAVQVFERKTKEYLITGCRMTPYDFGDEEVLTKEDVIKMNQERQVMLAEIEKRYNDRQVEKAKNSGGFSINNEIKDEEFIF